MKITAFHGTQNKFNKFELNSQLSNNTYGGTIDNGLGIFFTDNLTMAKWFGQAIKYSSDDDGYINTDTQAYLITAELTLNKSLEFKNENEKFDDSYQQYFEFIEKIGGVDICREKLLSAGYDSIIIYNADTNYYADGTYDAYVIFNIENIKIISNKLIINDFKEINMFDVNKFKVETEKTYNEYGKVNGITYIINGIIICKVRKYYEYFCSPGSILRDVQKIANETIWDLDNIKKLTNIESEKPYSYWFKSIYPNTNYSEFTGRIISLKEIKDTIIDFVLKNTNKNLNQQANTNGELYTTETYSPESKIDYKPTINSVPLSY